MLVTNHQNYQPELIEMIINFLNLDDSENTDNILSIENHKRDLEILFYKHPKKVVFDVVRFICNYYEGSDNYKFYIFSETQQI